MIVPKTDHPSEMILLGGGWEANSERPMLSVELRMRLLAACAFVALGGIDSIIFSGGLVDKRSKVNEAEGMAEYFVNRYNQLNQENQFPAREELVLTLDSDCYDTVSSARSVASMVEATGSVNEQRYLLTSRSHLARSMKIFRSAGLDVLPVEAEPLFSTISQHHESFARDYLHSMRYAKCVALEGIMRTALVVDKEGKISQRLAGAVRKDIRS